MSNDFIQQLRQYGPDADYATPTLTEAQMWCRQLARSHYENFSVASFLLPRRLRQPFFDVYAYCRWSDDLADEVNDPARSLELLDWWAVELERCFDGEAHHPVFVALMETVGRFELPIGPFTDLLVAFRRDQSVTRYESIDDLTDYCRYSANPVGRIVLALGGCLNDEMQRLSDSVCTGLQLVNFWQDVARDWDDNRRLYIPTDVMRQFGYDELRIGKKCADAEFRQMIAYLVDDAQQRLLAGEELAEQVPSWLKHDIRLFMRGGLAVVRAIRRQEYDVWTSRPKLSRSAKLGLVLGTLAERLLPGR